MEPAGKPKFQMIDVEQLFESPQAKQEKQNGMYFSNQVKSCLFTFISMVFFNYYSFLMTYSSKTL